jgi:hypothetical protein
VKIIFVYVFDINGPSWLQNFITKSKLIQEIICKTHQIGWHLKYPQKLTSKENLQKLDSFWVPDEKNPFL